MIKLTNIEIDGSKLQLLRKQCRWTQQQVADIVGKNKQTISSYESGRGIPPGNVLARLLTLYNAPKEAVISYKA